MTELKTIRDFIRYGASEFGRAGLTFGHGYDNALDEATQLVLHVLHLPHDLSPVYASSRLTQAEREEILALFRRRIDERIPACYLTGEAWFAGLAFKSDARALVPRSPIAEALDEALSQWLDLHPRAPTWPGSILDLCTGGGSLAIVAADRFPDAQVVGADLSSDALALAAVNRDRYGLRERVELVQGDLFAPVRNRRFDLVLCNPPYVNDASMQALPPEFRAEPRAALAGGHDGMDLVRRLLADAPAHLCEDGLLLLEIGHEAAHFEAAFPSLEFHYLPVAAGERMLVLVEAAQLAAAARRARARRPASRTAATRPRARRP